MRGSAPSMSVLRPRSAAEAVRVFGERPDALPLAGGTDFMVAWNVGQMNRRTVLDLSAVVEWAKIREVPGGVRIGALATHSLIQENPLVARHLPLMARSCATVGAVQIQNRGTLGGNIANASPAGDTFPALAVYEAMVLTVSPTGPRRVPVLEVFAGVKRTTLRPAELIEAVEIPLLLKRPTRQIFRKVGTRAAQAISKTVMAGLLWLGKGRAVEEVRLAFGSVAPTVKRLRTVEEFLRGRELTPDAVGQAAALVERDISPIDDIRSTRAYRLRVSQNLVQAFLEGRA